MLESFMMLAFLESVFPILVVVLGIGFLIFVHELGHFAVAKWNKVRVEAFSLGFGPVIWGFWKGETHYRLSLVPLGGYVKMAGETGADEHTDDPAEFLNKPIPVRAAVLFAGVVMNAIVGIALFMIAFNVGVPLVTPVAGGVTPGGAADLAGIRSGDRILEVGGTEVIDFTDVMQEIAFSSGPVDILIERNGEKILLQGIEASRRSGLIQRIGIQPPTPILHIDADGPAAEAGLKTGDLIIGAGRLRSDDPLLIGYELSFGHTPIPIVVNRDGEELTFTVTPREIPEGDPIAGVAPLMDRIAGYWSNSRWGEFGVEHGDRIATVNGTAARSVLHARDLAAKAAPAPVVFEVGRVGKDALVKLAPVTGIPDAAGWNSLFDQLAATPGNYKTRFVTLTDDRVFEDGNPSRKAGLPEGAEILAVSDHETKTWDDIRNTIHSFSSDQPLTFKYRVDEGEPQTVTVTRRRMNKRLFGIAFEATSEVVRREGIGASIQAGLRRSLHTGMGILRMLGGILTGRVSGKALGGPIAIFDISMKSAKKDFIHFLYFLGILSINLAILNILPIPVLDGGHLLFLLIEAIRRKPLPERAMAMFQWAGFLFLILLMVFVVFNDLERILT